MRIKHRLSFDVTFEGCERAPTIEDLQDVSVDFDNPDCCIITRGNVTVDKDSDSRVEELEEAITNASLLICESAAPEAKAAMRVFAEAMDAAAMKRMGI